MPRSHAELLERIGRAWAGLEQTIGEADQAHLTALGPPAGWSIKDHLAHLATWELSLIALLRGDSRAVAMGLDEAFHRSADLDTLNATIYERNKDRPLPDVLATLRQSHERLLAVLRGLDDDDLFKPYSHYQPHDPPYNAEPVIRWVVGNTYEHYRLHHARIRALLDRRDGDSPSVRTTSRR